MPTPLTREAMARRLARDIPDGSYVNLGIGMPVLVAAHLPPCLLYTSPSPRD